MTSGVHGSEEDASTGVIAGARIVGVDNEDRRAGILGDSNTALAFSRAALSIRQGSCFSHAFILRLLLLLTYAEKTAIVCV